MVLKIKKIISGLLNKNRINGVTRRDVKMIKKVISNIPELKIDFSFEKVYLTKWSQLLKTASPIWFRAYSNLLENNDINIVPDNIYHAIIEPILNNYDFCSFYEEKNFYDFIFRNYNLPKTLVRAIDGVYYDENYQKIMVDDYYLNKIICYKKIIVKPTINSGSGKNVCLFSYSESNECFKNSNNEFLTFDFLNRVYKNNFIIQESVEQHQMLKSLNPTSVNTFRILTYRSVSDNDIKVLHVTLRVGAKGSHLDNAHAGGRFCGVSADGVLLNKSFDDKGVCSNFINDTDLRNNYKIPNFEDILSFAKNIAENAYHIRLLSLDIMLDEHAKPKLIELNPKGQGVFIFQMTNGSMFGEYTDEVIEYCKLKFPEFIGHYKLTL